MLEQLFPVRHAQYQVGAAAPILEEFASWLINARYSRQSTQGHVQRLKRVLAAVRSVPRQWSSAKLDRAFSVVSGESGPLRTTARPFRQHLKSAWSVGRGRESRSFCGSAGALYQQHLVQTRGLAARAFVNVVGKISS